MFQIVAGTSVVVGIVYHGSWSCNYDSDMWRLAIWGFLARKSAWDAPLTVSMVVVVSCVV